MKNRDQILENRSKSNLTFSKSGFRFEIVIQDLRSDHAASEMAPGWFEDSVRDGFSSLEHVVHLLETDMLAVITANFTCPQKIFEMEK